MAKLNFSLDGKLLGEFALDKERTSIGRRLSNDIHIDNLAVSGEHAVIITMGNDSFLEDLNSTNGTMVNQKLIKKHVLQHDDVIEFGKYQLKYISGGAVKNTKSADAGLAPVAAVAAPVMAEPSVKPAQATTASPAASPQSMQSPASAQGVAHLQVLSGANAGQELLLNKAMTKLGSAGEQLALITKRPQGYFVTHVEGNQHPIVNGKLIGVQAHALNNLDVIEVSGEKMELHLA